MKKKLFVLPIIALLACESETERLEKVKLNKEDSIRKSIISKWCAPGDSFNSASIHITYDSIKPGGLKYYKYEVKENYIEFNTENSLEGIRLYNIKIQKDTFSFQEKHDESNEMHTTYGYKCK